MKVVLDLTRLHQEGKITQDEFDRLGRYAASETGSLAINLLIGFGVVAVSGGLLAMQPSELAAAAIGSAILGLGLGITYSAGRRWDVLAVICVLTGALLLAGGIVAYGEASPAAFLISAALLGAAGVVARSGLLVALAVIGLAAALGSSTGYRHAVYQLTVTEPALTVLLFGLLAYAANRLAHHLAADYARLALIAARTSVLAVNFGFWIGSLWGDRLMLSRLLVDPIAAADTSLPAVVIPAWAFSIGWAAALIGAAIWAVRVNRRWLVNVAAIFGAIHFYTQWFERLGATPVSVLLGGLLALGFAIALWTFNNRQSDATP